MILRIDFETQPEKVNSFNEFVVDL